MGEKLSRKKGQPWKYSYAHVRFRRKKENLSILNHSSLVRNGFKEIVQYLISMGISTNEQETKFQLTPLDISIAMQHHDISKILITHANQYSLNSGLHAAAQEGAIQLIEMLLDHGADMNHKTLDLGSTPLDRAAYNGHLPVVIKLIERGAKVNSTSKDNRMPLWNVCQNGHYEICKYLISKGAVIEHKRSSDGATPLLVSVLKGHSRIVELLLENGANLKSICNGKTVLQWVQTKQDPYITHLCSRYETKQKSK